MRTTLAARIPHGRGGRQGHDRYRGIHCRRFALLRRVRKKRRHLADARTTKMRVLGRDHRDTLVTTGNLAISLSGQGKHAEAAEIEREILIQRTRLLGAEHESTLMSALQPGDLAPAVRSTDGGGEAPPQHTGSGSARAPGPD